VYRYSSLGERYREPARPHPEFERPSNPCVLDEEIDSRIHDSRIEQLRLILVVPGRDALIEVTV
jgi:hypothetical protein